MIKIRSVLLTWKKLFELFIFRICFRKFTQFATNCYNCKTKTFIEIIVNIFFFSFWKSRELIRDKEIRQSKKLDNSGKIKGISRDGVRVGDGYAPRLCIRYNIQQAEVS